MTNQHTLRLEAGTETAWVLAGSSAVEYSMVNEYLGYLADRNYSPRTVRAYGYDLLAFSRWLDAEGIALDAVSTDVVLNFMHFCRQAVIKDRPANVVSMSGRRLDGYAATTINHRLAALAGLFTFAAEADGWINAKEIRATAHAYRAEAEFFADTGHDMMLELEWVAVAERIHTWLGTRGF